MLLECSFLRGSYAFEEVCMLLRVTPHGARGGGEGAVTSSHERTAQPSIISVCLELRNLRSFQVPKPTARSAVGVSLYLYMYASYAHSH
jgi:hypothetical protein